MQALESINNKLFTHKISKIPPAKFFQRNPLFFGIPPWWIIFTKPWYSIHGWKGINVNPQFIGVIKMACQNSRNLAFFNIKWQNSHKEEGQNNKNTISCIFDLVTILSTHRDKITDWRIIGMQRQSYQSPCTQQTLPHTQKKKKKRERSTRQQAIGCSLHKFFFPKRKQQ